MKEIMLGMQLLLIVILTAFSAFFVATEFSIVRVRPAKIEQLVEEGHKNALSVKKIIENMDSYLSACQLGITITSLGLGWLGQPTILKLIQPLMKEVSVPTALSQGLAFAISFSIITYINVVIGELFPKSVAIILTEKISLLVSKPLIWFYNLMYPFIWILNTSSRQVAKLWGITDPTANNDALSEEELQIVLKESYKNGEISLSEYNYVNRIFEFDNRLANEIMIPRTEMITLSDNISMEEAINIIQRERYTRYPLTKKEDKDIIIGFIHIKQLLTDWIKNNVENKTLLDYAQPIIHIMEATPIQAVFLKMQKERSSIAILHDEFGGTAGLITAEDILEEIVGEIRDEFDEEETPLIQKINDHHYILDSKLPITEVNNLLSLSIDRDELHTLGGWILFQNPNFKKGETLEYNGYIFKIDKMIRQHIFTFDVQKIPSPLT
ncbi:hemolysin family protein [Niallia sp.]|uniref:hemolysin family protein n=1 Tax=Niallia sp. TaxID=2837523 RepID=UPI002899086D|nr:hemolysin family protein [Niallia sp.]